MSHPKERPSIQKNQISNFQNSQKIPEWERSLHFEVWLNNKIWKNYVSNKNKRRKKNYGALCLQITVV